MNLEILLVLQAPATVAVTLYAATAAWMSPLLDYPLFAVVPAHAFRAFHQSYTRRVIPVVVLPVLVALVALIVQVQVAEPGRARAFAYLGVLSAALAVVLTATVAIPIHQRLGREGFCLREVHRLQRVSVLRAGLFTVSAASLLGSLG